MTWNTIVTTTVFDGKEISITAHNPLCPPQRQAIAKDYMLRSQWDADQPTTLIKLLNTSIQKRCSIFVCLILPASNKNIATKSMILRRKPMTWNTIVTTTGFDGREVSITAHNPLCPPQGQAIAKDCMTRSQWDADQPTTLIKLLNTSIQKRCSIFCLSHPAGVQ